MTSIADRITECIKASGLTKTAFAERINVGQPFVSKIASGASVPSDRTISDICREFNVNELWLRTGEGDMFVQLSRDDEIAQFFGSVLNDADDKTFKKRFISMLSRLDESDWVVLERMAKHMVEEKKKD